LLSEESDILLLDEPTSSVDPVTEQQIYKRIFETYTEKAIVSALHKLHLVGLFDTIYVFEK
jgi:ABC-type transport system involved in cytochrome bd biosynthesis fused ATPase/permease subunit